MAIRQTLAAAEAAAIEAQAAAAQARDEADAAALQLEARARRAALLDDEDRLHVCAAGRAGRISSSGGADEGLPDKIWTNGSAVRVTALGGTVLGNVHEGRAFLYRLGYIISATCP